MKNLFKKNYIKIIYPFFLGLLTSFSLPPYNYFIINFFTLSLFFIFIVNQRETIKKKFIYFRYGWLFGFGYFISSLYWITIALTFDENFKILIPISLILIPAFLAIFYGLALYIFSFFIKNKNISLILIFSVSFAIIEFIRGSILTGFPWNLFAFSFSKNLAFIQILSVVGTYGFNKICITFFLAPTIFILEKKGKKIFEAIFFLFLATSLLIFGNMKLNTQKLITLKKNNYIIKIISPKIAINKFYNYDNEKKIIKDLINLSNPNIDIPTIFIWPEGVLSAVDLKNILQYKNLFIKSFSEKHLIILGINDAVVTNNGQVKIYNSLAVIDKNLDVKNLYYKNKLVPFGEFLPLENYLKQFGLRSITNDYQSFSNGEKRKVIDIKNEYFSFNFLPLICYEIIYSGKLFDSSNFDFIINISEDGWFGDSVGQYQHFTHSIYRAIEEGKDVIRSANNGITAHIDGNGLVIKQIESTQSGVIEITEFKKIKPTIFSKLGNKMFFYLLLIYISFVFFINKQGIK